MAQREIKVIANSQNRNEIYMSDANTVGELKAELLNKGYELNGMDLKEGKTRIDLRDDVSPLPTDFMYRGEQTSDLVVMITPVNTNIKSGAYRDDLYDEVRNFNLQDEFYARFGKNFTNASNAELQAVIDDYHYNNAAMTRSEIKELVKSEVNEQLEGRTEKSEYSLNSIALCVLKVIDWLESVGAAKKENAKKWRAAIRKDYAPYSAEELADMQR